MLPLPRWAVGPPKLKLAVAETCLARNSVIFFHHPDVMRVMAYEHTLTDAERFHVEGLQIYWGEAFLDQLGVLN